MRLHNTSKTAKQPATQRTVQAAFLNVANTLKQHDKDSKRGIY